MLDYRNEILKEIGLRIKEVREEQSQEEFARDTSTIKQTISKYEKGKIMPGGDFLYMLLRTRFVNLNWLLTGKGNKFIESELKIIRKKFKEVKASLKK